MTKKLNILDTVTYLYLYIPVIIFLLFWIRLRFALPTLILLGVMFFGIIKNKKNNVNRINLNIWLLISTFIIFILLLIWCIYSGQGGFNPQYYDWQKHNVILNDLVNNKWPVRYEMDGRQGVLSYYIGFYLVPALIGKVTNFDVAQDAIIFWTALGLLLLILNIYQLYGNNHVKNLYLILFGLILFGTFIYIFSVIYHNWNPTDYQAIGVGACGDWFSHNLKIQYTTNITQLCYVFPQMIPAAIATVLFMKNIDNISVWGIICASLVLYSTFTFVGLIFLMILVLIYKLIVQRNVIKQNLKQLVSFGNICSILVIGVLALYILCNIMQPKPESAGMEFKLIEYQKELGGFILFQLSWILWVLILSKYEKHNFMMWGASIILFILPFYEFGGANDFCMRVSIPSLFVLNILVIKNMIGHFKDNSFYSWTLVLLLLLTGVAPMGQLNKNPWPNVMQNKHEYNMPFKYGTEFYKTSDVVKYQYVDWDANKGIAKILLKK